MDGNQDRGVPMRRPARIATFLRMRMLAGAMLFLGACGESRSTASPSRASTETFRSSVMVTDTAPNRERIALQRIAEIGDIDGDGQVYQNSRLRISSDGRVFVTSNLSRGVIKVFARDGSFVRAFGGTGDGPGEFRFPAAIIETGTGELLIFDRGSRRVSRVGADYEVLGSSQAPIVDQVRDYALLPNGTIAVAAASRDPALSRFPLHLVGLDGGLVRSFGDRDAEATGPSYSLFQVLSEADSDGNFWSSRVNRYQLYQWSSEGQLLRQLERRTDWFEPWESPTSSVLDEPPEPVILEVDADSAGRIWVLTRVPGENWRPMEPARLEGGESYISPEQEAVLYDTIVEIIDPESGEVIASQRLQENLIGFAGPGISYSYLEDEIGHPRYPLYRLRLLPE